MNITTLSRYEKDTSVLGRLTQKDIDDSMRSETGIAFRELFRELQPWMTYGTLTVRPGFGERVVSGVSQEAMTRLVHKFFARRCMREIKYFWCVEKHLSEEYGGKGGTHAHFVTGPMDRGGRKFWRRQWEWWFALRGYGFFRTVPVNDAHTQKLAAYLSKYLSKDTKTCGWGLARFAQLRNDPPAIKGHRRARDDTDPETVLEGSKEEYRLLRGTLDWSRKFKPAGAKYIYRKPVKYEV